jgi:hypothetical protein
MKAACVVRVVAEEDFGDFPDQVDRTLAEKVQRTYCIGPAPVDRSKTLETQSSPKPGSTTPMWANPASK